MSQSGNTPSGPSRARTLRTGAAALGLALLAACSSDRVAGPGTAAPSAAPSASLLPLGGVLRGVVNFLGDATRRLTGTELDALKATFHTTAADLELPVWRPATLTCGVATTATATQSVGPAGGVLRFGRGTLLIPEGALASEVQITATATLGSEVSVDFAPHGLQFAKAVEVRVDYDGCRPPSTHAGLNVFYTNAGGLITQTMPSADDRDGTAIRALTDHFSGYIVAWGRRPAGQ